MILLISINLVTIGARGVRRIWIQLHFAIYGFCILTSTLWSVLEVNVFKKVCISARGHIMNTL